MIYAKIDVKLRDHARAQLAGSAMATWTWGLLYAREQETDGYIPDVALRGSWVPDEAKKHAKKLVEVGLWERADTGPDGGGWRICRYASKNETREVIAERRAEATERMKRVRANKERTPSEPHSVEQRAVPGSGYGSGFGSDLESRSEEPTQVPRATPPPANDNAPPTWWAVACQTVAAEVAPVDEPGARWLEYSAARERKGWAVNQRDAVGWLSQVVRRERRDAPRRKVDTRQPLTGPEPEWLTRAKTGTDGTEAF